MKRRALLAAALSALAFAPLAPHALAQTRAASAAVPQVTPLTGEARARAIASVNSALNAQAAVQGRFRQINPDGSAASGAFYMQRPGRLRFDYDPPAALLVVADGSTVAVVDEDLRTTNRSPLRETPLYFVLKRDLDLNRDARVTSVYRQGGALMVSARDRQGQADGELTLRFTGGAAPQLQGWDVIDATGARTRVTLTNLQTASRLDPQLFRLRRDQLPRSNRP